MQVALHCTFRLQALCLEELDDGLAVPPEILSQLFQKFVTGSQKGRGSGLGLAFCKLAVEAHGQQIWADSVPGQGTVLTFTMAAAH